MRCFAIVLVALAAAATAMPAAQEQEGGVIATAMNLVKECNGDLSLCLKERALRYVESLQGDLQVTDGVALVASPESSRQQGARALKDEPLSEDAAVREGQVEGLLVDRVARFLEGHTLQLKVPKESIDEMKRSMEEGRKKKKKLLLPLLLLLKLKAAALIPLVLGFLALVAFKALIIGKLALLISGVIGVKKLLESKGGSSSYEVVGHPHYSEEHHGGGHGWGRSAQELAYNAHKQE